MKTAVCAAVICVLLAAGFATAAAPVPVFDHVVVIVFENKEATSILGNHHRPKKLRVGLPSDYVNGVVVEALSGFILMISR